MDDFQETLNRARQLVTELEEEPRENPATGTSEFALRDPYGCYLMISDLNAT